MRFSLATLLLIVLFAASLINAWFVPKVSWVVAEKLPYEAEVEYRWRGSRLSPDGRRKLENLDVEDSGSRTFVCDMGGKRLQFIHANQEGWQKASDSAFVSDDCIVQVVDWTTDFNSTQKAPGFVQFYRRRFPEWWWGHFYRPEVWTSIALGIALIVRAWNSSRRRVVES